MPRSANFRPTDLKSYFVILLEAWRPDFLSPFNPECRSDFILASKIKDKQVFVGSYISLNFILIIIGIFFNWGSKGYEFLSIPDIQEWIMGVPATAGSRAIMIGIALGVVAQSFRIMTGRERSILGD